MARTLQQQIDDNDAAIERAESAQLTTLRGKTQQQALLATLYKERERLEAQQARETRSPIRVAKLGRAGGA